MPRSGRTLYLAYGSNLHPLRLNDRLGPSELVTTVALPGWRLRFDKRGADGSAKANLGPAPGSEHVAWGAIYDVSVKQLLRLDQYEGWGTGYETVWFEVSASSEKVRCLSYIAPSHWTSNAMKPFDWYRKLIVAGAQYHGFPYSYVRMITGGDSIADPDSDRARQQEMLIAQIEAHPG